MAPSPFKPALIVVDMQNDFCPPNGSLAVEGARDLAPAINTLLNLPFSVIVATQDWHPANHISFASNHPPPNNVPFTSFVTLKNPNPAPGEPLEKPQRLWPAHCIQNSPGAEVIEELDTTNVHYLVKKGMDPTMEMYSTFSSAFSHYNCHPHGVTHDLIQIFRDNQVTHVYNVGIAGDYCLKSTAVDAAKVGFKSYVVKEGVRSVDEGAEGWGAACKEMEDVGVELVNLEGIEVGWVKEEGGK